LTLAQLLLSQGDIENAVLQLETITGLKFIKHKINFKIKINK